MKNYKYIVTNIFLIIFLIFAVLIYLFKLVPLIVISDSMAPTIKKGDLLLIAKDDQFEVDEIISFKNEGLIATHRVAEIEQNDSKENIKYKTKGDANKSTDYRLVETKNILGKVMIIIPYLGIVFMIFKSKYLLVSILIFFIFILVQKIKNDTK